MSARLSERLTAQKRLREQVKVPWGFLALLCLSCSRARALVRACVSACVAVLGCAASWAGGGAAPLVPAGCSCWVVRWFSLKACGCCCWLLRGPVGCFGGGGPVLAFFACRGASPSLRVLLVQTKLLAWPRSARCLGLGFALLGFARLAPLLAWLARLYFYENQS